MNKTAGPLILGRDVIMAALGGVDVVAAMERAFEDYSAGGAQISAVGELLFERPPGEVHVKAGRLSGSEVFVVKVASGFYENPGIGLASSSGVMLLFSALTGRVVAILLDEGRLTDERTAAAGAVAAKYLAPSDPGRIGVLGAGVQAELQLRYLRAVTPCREVSVWARRPGAGDDLARKARELGFSARVEDSPAALAACCRLIVTTTPSRAPLLHAADIAPGTHINAVGADTPEKAELAEDLLAAADLCVADSVAQCRERGEFRRLARNAGVSELGDVIAGRAPGRSAPAQITIADLTGLAVQDAAIAEAILRACVAVA